MNKVVLVSVGTFALGIAIAVADAETMTIRTPLGNMQIQVDPRQRQSPGQEYPKEQQPISNQPSFDCNRARTAVAVILCRAPGGAAADWALVFSGWAKKATLTEEEANAFDTAETQWVMS